MVIDILLLIITLVMHTIIVGFLFALPVWLYWVTQKFFWRRPPKLNLTFIALVGVISFTTAASIYTYQFIKFGYDLSLVSGPFSMSEEHLKHQNEIIDDAVVFSFIPPVFQKQCSGESRTICELGKKYSLKFWVAELSIDDLPLLGGISAALGSILFVVNGKDLFQEE